MSYTPKALGRNDPTSEVLELPSLQPVAQGNPVVSSAPFAFSHCTADVSPQYHGEIVPARAAYSHSAALGRRYLTPVCSDSHET